MIAVEEIEYTIYCSVCGRQCCSVEEEALVAPGERPAPFGVSHCCRAKYLLPSQVTKRERDQGMLDVLDRIPGGVGQ